MAIKYLISFIFVTIFFSSLNAHEGQLDKKGCHYNNEKKATECHRKKATERRSTKKPKKAKEQPLVAYDPKFYNYPIDKDQDCQNTRTEVLIEESLIPVKFATAKQCKVVEGKWLDPYTDEIFTDPFLLIVTHVVPLEEVHESGGHAWSPEKKENYANDLKNSYHLVVVSKNTSRQKRKKDPSQWMPPNKKISLEYILIWGKIKRDWGLSFEKAEIQKIEEIVRGSSLADAQKLYLIKGK